MDCLGCTFRPINCLCYLTLDLLQGVFACSDPAKGFSFPCAIKKSGPLDLGNQLPYFDSSLPFNTTIIGHILAMQAILKTQTYDIVLLAT